MLGGSDKEVQMVPGMKASWQKWETHTSNHEARALVSKDSGKLKRSLPTLGSCGGRDVQSNKLTRILKKKAAPTCLQQATARKNPRWAEAELWGLLRRDFFCVTKGAKCKMQLYVASYTQLTLGAGTKLRIWTERRIF